MARAARQEQVVILNRRLHDLTRLASDWVWETDQDFRLTATSDRSLEILGLHPHEVLGLSFMDFGAFETEAQTSREFWRSPFRNVLFEIANSEPSTRFLLVSGLPIFDPRTGAFTGVFGTAKDITAEKEHERKLATAKAGLEKNVRERTSNLRHANRELQKAKDVAVLANRTKTEFLANMSHELRTPLNAIIGFAQFILAGHSGEITPKQDELVSDIRDSGDHLLSLVNDILDLSRIELGEVEIAGDDVDLGECIQSCVRLIRDRIERASLTLRTTGLADLPHVRADQRKIKQVIINLLSNATKFTNSGGSITVSGRMHHENGCSLEISDTGIGMTTSDIEKALTIFGQVDSGLDRAFDGAGLGLPLSKALIEAHGGKLEIQSRSGEGTSVTVFLPAERIVRPTASPIKDASARRPVN